MRYPSFDQYQSALQSPKYCFKLTDLQSGVLEKDLWGFPQVRSGGFALTYKLWIEDKCLGSDVFIRMWKIVLIGIAISIDSFLKTKTHFSFLSVIILMPYG
jgi:hypothetical protein